MNTLRIREMAPTNEETPLDDKGAIPFDTRIDLIERELRVALTDCEELRKLNRATKVKARNRILLLEAALRNAKYYLKELDKSLGFDKD